MRNAGIILLAILLILIGLVALVNFSFPSLPLIMAIIALIAGVLLLFDFPRGRRAGAGQIGKVLLGIYLILWALQAFGVSFAGMDTILAILALIAGILLIISRGRFGAGDIGFVLLGIYLILVGLQLFGVTFAGIGTVLAILAIAAGVLLLIRR